MGLLCDVLAEGPNMQNLRNFAYAPFYIIYFKCLFLLIKHKNPNYPDKTKQNPSTFKVFTRAANHLQSGLFSVCSIHFRKWLNCSDVRS